MESTSCFCLVATAVFFITVWWRLKRGPRWGTGDWAVAFGASLGALLGASLYPSDPLVSCGLVFLICSFILTCVTWRRAELLPPKGRVVLLTGCDSGFGYALAKRLSSMGVTVFAGVLDVNGAGAQQLRATGQENLHVLQLDVTDGCQIEAAHRHICTQVADTGLWALVNNAGVLRCPADAELQPLREYRHCLEVNFLSAVRMSQVFLPLLRRSRGRIVNVSSLGGDVPLPMCAAYGASKAALSMFSRVMRLEMSAWGVTVSVVQPSGFRTGIFGSRDDAAFYRNEMLKAISPGAVEDYGEAYISSLPSRLRDMSQQSAADVSPVVDDMCHAVLSPGPRSTYTPGSMGWLLPFLYRCCPDAVFDAFALRLIHNGEHRPAGLQRC